MVGVASGYPRTHRLCTRWARLASHQADSCTETGRHPAPRVALLFGINSPRGLDRIARQYRADTAAGAVIGARSGGNVIIGFRGKGRRLALRDRTRRFVRRGKMLAAGAVRRSRGSLDFRMLRRCDTFRHAQREGNGRSNLFRHEMPSMFPAELPRGSPLHDSDRRGIGLLSRATGSKRSEKFPTLEQPECLRHARFDGPLSWTATAQSARKWATSIMWTGCRFFPSRPRRFAN